MIRFILITLMIFLIIFFALGTIAEFHNKNIYLSLFYGYTTLYLLKRYIKDTD